MVPLFKCGDKNLLSNYRPVSVLTIFSKFLENVVYNHLTQYLDKYEILHNTYNNQYGLRKKHSTSLALLYLQNKITSTIDDRKHSVESFLDLSKGFDTVNHCTLLDKLEHYGHCTILYSISLSIMGPWSGPREQEDILYALRRYGLLKCP